MNLIQAFGFTREDCISFIGAGNKASTIFQIARQYQCPVLVTTTTNIGGDEIALADNHIFLDGNIHLQAKGPDNFPGVTLITGPGSNDGRFGSPKLTQLKEIHKFCRDNRFPLLIKAESTHENALGAPGDKEPVIPSFSTCVVSVVGLMRNEELLGWNLERRSEIPAYGSSLVNDGIIATDPSPIGSLSKNRDIKNGQGDVDQYLIINVSGPIQTQALAGKIAGNLLNLFEKIGICHWNSEMQLIARKKPIAAVILAAGGATRFGNPKQLNIWREKTYTENVVIAAQQSGSSPIIVVTGYQHENLEDILKVYPVQIVYNPDWQNGQSTSMKVGLERLSRHTQGVIFLMADQPQISTRLIRAIMEQAYLTDREVIGPMIDGKRSTPMFFDRDVFPELMKVEGDQGGRSILHKYQPLLIEWFDTRMGMDIDHITDLGYLRTIE